MQSANAYKLKIGEKRFSAVIYRSPSICVYKILTKEMSSSLWRIEYEMATYEMVRYMQTTNGFVLIPKSNHKNFASSRICVYRSVILRYTHRSSVYREVPVLVSIQGR